MFGTVRILEQEEKRMAIEKLALKYAPKESEESRRLEIEGAWERFCILELASDHISGKESIELKKNH